MAGFGRAPFGAGPFGRSDTGNDLIVKRFPTTYFDDSLLIPPGQTITNNTVDPLLFVLKTYANSVFQRRLDIDSLPSLIDYQSAPLSIVELMGDMFGISIDKNDPGFLQRTLLGSASQWLQIKASKQGYSVRGLASGFAVTVGNFWRIDPIYIPLFPARFLYFLVPAEADPTAVAIVHTDQPPGTIAGTPTEEDGTYAKSAYLKLIFQIVQRVPFVDYNTLLDLVISKIKDVVGIHHETLPPQLLTIINVAAPTSATIYINESGIFQASECYYFDITPADVIETDVCFPTVSLLFADGVILTADLTLGCDIENDETDIPIIDIDAGISSLVSSLEEVCVIDFDLNQSIHIEMVDVEFGLIVGESVTFFLEDDETEYDVTANVETTATVFAEIAYPAIEVDLVNKLLSTEVTQITLTSVKTLTLQIQEDWSLASTESINATPILSEISIGKNFGKNTYPIMNVGIGWWIDVFPYYDDTLCDVQETDQNGYVTMTIQIGP